VKPLPGWYPFVKSQPCAACGKHGTHDDPIEAAHIRVLTSPKTGALLPRSHNGLAAYGCLPLHRSEHLALGATSETRWLRDHVGQARAFSVVATLILRFFMEHHTGNAEEVPDG
jgi:hypothetical protein